MIYHYSSVDKLLKIIESKKLYLFNAYNMNDNLEIYWINHLLNEEFQKYDSNNEIINEVIENYKIANSIPYICCFSYERDLLSQWRAYADDGAGIAIGFDETKFNVENKIPVTGLSWKNSTGLYECIYNEEEQKKIIHSLIEDCINNTKDGKSLQLFELPTKLRMFSMIMKNPAFFEEREIRLIHLPLIMLDKNKQFQLTGNISSINFMKKGDGISSYFKFPLDSIFNDELIPEIILGPRCSVNVDDLRLLLYSNNLINTKIVRSKASYRTSC